LLEIQRHARTLPKSQVGQRGRLNRDGSAHPFALKIHHIFSGESRWTVI
jgi:hypothetical protein